MTKLGQIFEAMTGRSSNQIGNILDIESAAEQVIGHKLDFGKFQSQLVEETGNIFRISSSHSDDIDKKIDSHIERMKKALNKA
ncbi:MAG: hypothetical protein M0R41_13155 [Methylobacter tundripaludum]|nr:hypothetical protein [Methylobacter tundripaludum]